MDLVNNQLIYSTTRIDVEFDNNKQSGTGFFFNFKINNEDDRKVSTLITNKHVIENASKIHIHFNKADENNNPLVGQTTKVTIAEIKDYFMVHPDPKIDLAIANTSPLINLLKNNGDNAFVKGFAESLMLFDDDLDFITSGDDILMVGYPRGLKDDINNQPIFRKGITATNPNLKYNGKHEFLIDIAAYEGSSGSPVFLYYNGAYTTKDDKIEYGRKIKLLGILYGSIKFPEITKNFEIEELKQETYTKVFNYTNLGVCINAHCILDLKKVIENKYNIELI
jgi:hypothetical protein